MGSDIIPVLMKKWIVPFWLFLLGLGGCGTAYDDSVIDESSVAITQGIIREDFTVIHVDAQATGLKGYDAVLPDKGTGLRKIHEMGYTLIYEVYDPQWVLVEKRTQDIGKDGDLTSFSTMDLTIPNPQWSDDDDSRSYTLILRLKIVNKPLSTVSKQFQLRSAG